jgi:hypothetical protein
LIDGLKAKGFCFDTLDHHPAYQAWVQQRAQLVLKTGSKP